MVFSLFFVDFSLFSLFSLFFLYKAPPIKKLEYLMEGAPFIWKKQGKQ